MRTRRSVPPRPAPAVSFALLAAVLGVGAGAAPARPGPVDFAAEVRPIFNAHCAACHGGVRQQGGLNLIDEEAVRAVVEPGAPEFSYLLDRVRDPDDETRMPPPAHGPRLSDAELDTLARWVAEGANWRRHWSFDPPVRHEPPAVGDPGWGRGPIDGFILATLDDAGLAPNPPAAPDRWLRRASLDLTGLPPSLEERADFLDAVNLNGEAAYAAAVDRLLASPHFGPRWASVWLDQVRYADSRGLGLDRRRTAWPYRDWVVRAFNDDLPFDDFTVKQLAGDLLPGANIEDRLATTAHRLTQTNEEGGTDDEEFRVAAAVDRVSTTWQVWQGLTMGCVQCHDHPYDPLAHAEFYEALALFNSTADADLDNEHPALAVPRDPADYDDAAALDARIEPLERRLWERGYESLTDAAAWSAPADLSATVTGTPGVEIIGGEYRLTGNVAQNTSVTLTADVPEDLETLTAVRFTGLPVDLESALKDAEWGFVVSHFRAELIGPDGSATDLTFAAVLGDEPDPATPPGESLNAKSKWGFGAYTKMHRPRSAAFVLKEPVAAPAGSAVRATLRFEVFELSAFPLVARRGRLDLSGDPRLAAFPADPTLEPARAELAELKKRRRGLGSVAVPVLRERPAHLARPTHRFGRGNFLDKEELVSPGVPAVLGGDARTPDRLAFARWVASPENPLTARVAVNRLWGRMFGAGLVRTEEDFGSTGEPPSHPELLDDLAARFFGEWDWSVKRALRAMALSSTYRQSAAVRPELLEIDPDNRLLARGPRKRLPAEAVRDAALFASGLLTERLRGEPVRPPIPDGVWKPFDGGDKWETAAIGDPDRTRRSLYTYVKRSIPHPVMASFDAPSREFCAARRPDGNTPVQALTTLNDATFAEAAAALADRMREHADDPAARARHGFLRVCGREPDRRELNALVELTDRVAAMPGGPDPWATAANVLLNLDEALTN